MSNNNRELSIYVIVTLGLSWLLWLPLALDMPVPRSFFMNVGVFMPTTMAVIMTYVSSGPNGVKALLASGVKYRLLWREYLYMFLLMPAIVGVAAALTILTGGALSPAQFPIIVIPLAFIIILFSMGPLGEEFGWRGYALNRLLDQHTPLAASIRLGGVWTLWHLPLFFIQGTVQQSMLSQGVLPALVGYTVHTMALTLLITVLFVRTGGSVFAALCMHTMSNLSQGLMPVVFSTTGSLYYVITLSVVTFWVWRNQISTLQNRNSAYHPR